MLGRWGKSRRRRRVGAWHLHRFRRETGSLEPPKKEYQRLDFSPRTLISDLRSIR